MRAGKALRDKWALEAAGNKLCSCGHTLREHRELPLVLCYADGTTVDFAAPDVSRMDGLSYQPHPDHRPLHFHCGHDGCSCIRVEAPRC